jgi:hypothetical protein
VAAVELLLQTERAEAHELVAALVTQVDGSVVSALVEGDGSARRRTEEAVTRALG